MTTFNERVKQIFEQSNLTQSDFARKINVTPAYVWKLLNKDDSKPSDRLVEDISEKLDINKEWLLTGKGNMAKELTDQQKVMKYTAMLLKDTDSIVADAIKNFIITYEQLDESSKSVLENIALKYIDNMKKGQ
jgi:transcriptional regulator with XRE-family HTH domain